MRYVYMNDAVKPYPVDVYANKDRFILCFNGLKNYIYPQNDFYN